jgi:hypothetical protein
MATGIDKSAHLTIRTTDYQKRRTRGFASDITTLLRQCCRRTKRYRKTTQQRYFIIKSLLRMVMLDRFTPNRIAKIRAPPIDMLEYAFNDLLIIK